MPFTITDGVESNLHSDFACHGESTPRDKTGVALAGSDGPRAPGCIGSHLSSRPCCLGSVRWASVCRVCITVSRFLLVLLLLTFRSSDSSNERPKKKDKNKAMKNEIGLTRLVSSPGCLRPSVRREQSAPLRRRGGESAVYTTDVRRVGDRSELKRPNPLPFSKLRWIDWISKS